MANILVIDDSAVVRELVHRTLTTAHHRVAVARDGAAGMLELARSSVDLVITDVLMPEQDGLQTVREVRRTRPGVKIIVMSGRRTMGGLDVLDAAVKLGAHQTLRKPFTRDDLLRRVARCLEDGSGSDGARGRSSPLE